MSVTCPSLATFGPREPLLIGRRTSTRRAVALVAEDHRGDGLGGNRVARLNLLWRAVALSELADAGW
eukprot:4107485-Prymnesium_polylepis.1